MKRAVVMVWFLALGCAQPSISETCRQVELGTAVSEVPDVRFITCGEGGARPQTELFSRGPIEDIRCCKRAPDPAHPCAVDCQATGYADGGTLQVGRADEWDQCCIFVVNGQVAAAWVNWD